MSVATLAVSGMNTEEWIQFAALLIAIVSLLVQQWWQIAEMRQHEKRVEMKLDLFHLCHDTGLPESDLINEFLKRRSPMKVDPVEVRKAIYEMLAEETLRFRSDKTYKARRNKAKDDADDDRRNGN